MIANTLAFFKINIPANFLKISDQKKREREEHEEYGF